MHEEIVALIVDLAAELAQEEDWSLGELSENSTLFGENGLLDSMGLVTLVIAVEQAIEEKFAQSVSLADEKAFSQARSPYRSVDSLARYAESQLEEG